MMKSYVSKSGKKSGVIGYEIGGEYIRVMFEDKRIYTYSYDSESPSIIEHMKYLALKSEGLSTFISQQKPNFEK